MSVYGQSFVFGGPYAVAPIITNYVESSKIMGVGQEVIIGASVRLFELHLISPNDGSVSGFINVWAKDGNGVFIIAPVQLAVGDEIAYQSQAGRRCPGGVTWFASVAGIHASILGVNLPIGS